jgi:hypothetical protein
MQNYVNTKRTFKCSQSNEEYTLFFNPKTEGFKLEKTIENANYNFPIGTGVNGFEIRAYDVIYTFSNNSQLIVKKGEFLHLTLDNPYIKVQKL